MLVERELWDFVSGRKMDSVSRTSWAILIGVWKRVVLGAMWTRKTQLNNFYRRIILVNGLETVFATFWQRMLLLFGLVLRIFQRLN